MAINKVEVEGNLSRDPETKLSEGGAPYWAGSFGIPGVRWDRTTRQEVPKTTWARLVAFNDVARRLDEEGLVKGDSLLIVGALDTIVVDKNGAKETKTSIEVKSYDVQRRSRAARQAPAEQAEDPWGAPGGTR